MQNGLAGKKRNTSAHVHLYNARVTKHFQNYVLNMKREMRERILLETSKTRFVIGAANHKIKVAIIPTSRVIFDSS